MQPLVNNILTTFEGRDLNEPSYVLGMEVIRDRASGQSPLHTEK